MKTNISKPEITEKSPIKFAKFIKETLGKSSGLGIIFILVLLIALGSLISPDFLNAGNLMNILRQNSFIVIISCGITMLIISGQTDLSAGAVCAFGGVVAVDIFMKTNSVILAFLSAIVVGILCGAINGFVTTKFNVPPFITTLATSTSVRGATLLYTGGKNLYNIGEIANFGKGSIPIYFSLVICIISSFVLKKTMYGRHLYAVGGNADVALASGIDPHRVRIIAYIICSTSATISGLLLMGRLNSAMPVAAVGYEFEAIIGAIIGGTSFSGGIGNIGGSVIGVLIVGVINNILNLLGIHSYIHQIIKGFIIALAVVYDINMRNRKTS